MAKLEIKYRLEGKALPPRPVRISLPGWGGSPEMKKENGSQPQPWHCPLHVEGATHGLELIYEYDTEVRIVNNNGNVMVVRDREAEPGGGPGPNFSLSVPRPPQNYLFNTSLDIQAPPGYVLRTQPHPRFFADFTGTAPVALYGHVHSEWWPKQLFIVFKIPPPGGMAGMGASFFGFSATIASVVMSSPAMDAASCRAIRTTFVGSIMPLETKSPYWPSHNTNVSGAWTL